MLRVFLGKFTYFIINDEFDHFFGSKGLGSRMLILDPDPAKTRSPDSTGSGSTT